MMLAKIKKVRPEGVREEGGESLVGFACCC